MFNCYVIIRIPNRNKNTSKRPTLQDIFGNGSNNKNSNRFLPPVKNLTTAKTTPKPTRRPTQRPTKRPTKNTTKRPTKRPIFTSQRTTTELSVIKPFRRPDVSNSFQCDFETRSKECEVKFSGKKWQFFTSATDNFYEIILNGGQRSEIFFTKMVPPPSGGVACLTFRYRKFLDGKFLIGNFNVQLRVFTAYSASYKWQELTVGRFFFWMENITFFLTYRWW